jgi:hypothetical protein
MLFVRFKHRVVNKGGHQLSLFKKNYFQVPITNKLYFKKPKCSFSLQTNHFVDVQATPKGIRRRFCRTSLAPISLRPRADRGGGRGLGGHEDGEAEGRRRRFKRFRHFVRRRHAQETEAAVEAATHEQQEEQRCFGNLFVGRK